MEEELFKNDADAPLAEMFNLQKKRKLQSRPKQKKAPEEKDSCHILPKGIRVSLFDYEVENHFKVVETISKLCGEPETPDYNPAEIQRLSSSITFLREWRHFNYKPKTIRFAYQNESGTEKEVIGEISLPQFSAAAVHKEAQHGKAMPAHPSKDFILNVGGPVWALDWCPRFHLHSDTNMKAEFVAVAAHPPESSYHKIGVPLTGRGVIQIWCLLNIGTEEDPPSQIQKKQKRNYGKNQTDNPKSTETQRPRGRPRKYPPKESLNNLEASSLLPINVASKSSNEHVGPQGSEYLPFQAQNKHEQVCLKGQIDNAKTIKLQKPRGRPRKKPLIESLDNVDSSSHIEQAIAIQHPEDSSSFLTEEVVPSDNRKPVTRTVSGTAQETLIQIIGGDKLSLSSRKSNRLKDKARTRGQIHGDGPRLVSQDEGQESPSTNSRTSIQPKRPRGRQRKKPIAESSENIDSSSQCLQVLAIEYPEKSSLVPSVSVASEHDAPTHTGGWLEKERRTLAACDSLSAASKRKRLKDNAMTGDGAHAQGLPAMTQDERSELTSMTSDTFASCNPDFMRSSDNIISTCDSDTDTLRKSIPKDDVALPRLVLCLAHNGKVAWDIKWRPSNPNEKHCMGYLAVVLGNGALEVWEVPFPRTVKVIYPACKMEGTDPRFMKLEPVFRCSKLKCGDRQSIPLTVEWSASSPHDLILAGCHDGVVALWKFSTTGSLKDTRPLLRFCADTVPIRALAWAPAESYSKEGANVIVTAGHKGLKFWDIRDPFRPLWDFNPVQRVIYSLDWLPDPRCLIVSFDDGTLRILSLMKAAYDVPVTGKPFAGTQQQGFSSYFCSSFAIWNVHVSRKTGMVAYCGTDGNALSFQLTAKAVEKDPFRNRAPHFLCGSFGEEESALTVITPQSNVPFPMKKSLNEWGDTPRTKRGFLSVSNQKKRAKEQIAKNRTSDEVPLALCYGNDQLAEYDSDPSIAEKSNQSHKSKSANRRNPKNDEKALICRDEDLKTLQNGAEEESAIIDEIESFPPKIVAVHRVRWNLNKGSEKWLSYGGAAGIVRCLEVDVPTT